MDFSPMYGQAGDRRELLKRALSYSFKVFLALRIGSLAWVIGLSTIGSRAISEPNVLCRSTALLEGSVKLGRLLSPWLRWDTLCYLTIAEQGYAAHPELTVWPPFYPFLIRLVSFIFPPPLLAALVLSSLFAWLAFFLLYILTSERGDETVAKNTLFLYAIYPVAFFLVAGYTESLFLALVIGSLLLARRRFWLGAAVLAALAALMRNQGIVLAPVLLWEGVLQSREQQGLPIKALLAASLPVLAFGAFAVYVHEGLRAGWPWQTLAALWGQYSGFPWQGILGNIRQLFTLPVSPDLYWLPTTLLDLLMAILVPVVLIVHRHSMRSTYLVFAWLIFILASIKLGPNDTLVSFSRYMLAAFPFFVALSPALTRPHLRLAFFGICLVLQAIFLSMFYIWSWAG